MEKKGFRTTIHCRLEFHFPKFNYSAPEILLSRRNKTRRRVVDELEEQMLVRLCSEHDRKAEEDLYTEYAGRVFSICIRYSDNHEDAKDLMQEVFIKALSKIQTFKYKGKGSLNAWICRLTVNMALNKVRDRKVQFYSLDELGADAAIEPLVEDVSAIPEDVMLNMISNLPLVQRSVFNMFCIDGYSHKEIASQLGLTEKGSASILSKAKARLKEEINHYIKCSGIK